MDSLAISHLVFFILLGLSDIIQCNGQITIQGCTEAFYRMSCPQDDIISVSDFRFTKKGDGRVCNQTKPDTRRLRVPQELAHLCREVNGQPECFYAEDICEGLNDCAFYISPHLIAGKEMPTVNSEIIINYGCLAGPTRNTGIVVCALLATVSMLSVLIIGGLLLRRMWVPPPNYNNFRNEPGAPGRPVQDLPPPTSGYGAAAPPPGAAYRGHASATHTSAAVNDPEHISVTLQTPGGQQQPMDAPI